MTGLLCNSLILEPSSVRFGLQVGGYDPEARTELKRLGGHMLQIFISKKVVKKYAPWNNLCVEELVTLTTELLCNLLAKVYHSIFGSTEGVRCSRHGLLVLR